MFHHKLVNQDMKQVSTCGKNEKQRKLFHQKENREDDSCFLKHVYSEKILLLLPTNIVMVAKSQEIQRAATCLQKSS